MAIVFTPETGEGIVDSNSYLSIVDFKAVSDNLGKEYFDYTDDEIKLGLIRASTFLDSYFISRYPGVRNEGQGLEWPRTNALYLNGEEILDTVVPKEVKIALAEAFYILKSGADIQPTIAGNGILKEERVKVDVVEEHKKYNSSSTPKRTTYTVLEDAMARLTGGLSSFANLKIMRVGGFT